MLRWAGAWLAAVTAAVLAPTATTAAGALALACGWHTDRRTCRLLTCAVDLAVYRAHGGIALLCLKVAIEHGWFGDGRRGWLYFPVDAWAAAVRGGDLEAVEAGLDDGRRPDEVIDRRGGVSVTALAEAVNHGAVVEAMLEHRPRRRTLSEALAAAARAGHLGSLRLLLAAGADPNHRNRAGETPLMLALVPWFDEAGRTRCNTAAATALLEAGCPAGARDNTGRTALMRCAAAGSARGVELLLEAGEAATTGQDDPASTTALHLAAAARCPDTVRRLLAAGADPNARDAFNATPIATLIIEYPDSKRVGDVVEALLAGGADVLIPDEDGDPALHLAILMGHTERTVNRIATATEEQLAAAGTAGTAVNARNETALCEALWRAAARPDPQTVPVLRCLLRRVPEIRAAFVATYGEASLARARSGDIPAWIAGGDVVPAALPVVAPLRWGLGPRTAALWPAEARRAVRALMLCLRRWGPAVPAEMGRHIAGLLRA